MGLWKVLILAGTLGAAAAPHDATPQEKEVYAAFLNQTVKAGFLILENEAEDAFQPNRRAWESYLLKRISGPGQASAEALHAFLKRVPRKIRFFEFPRLKVPLRLLRSDEIQRHLKRGWDAFHDAYPGNTGFFTLSAVGWGDGGDEAVFAVRKQCGRKCGYRDVVVMKRVNGEWLLIIRQPLP